MTNVNCYCRGAGCIYCTEPNEATKSLNSAWQRVVEQARNPIHDGTDAWPCCECDNCKAWRSSDANKQPELRGYQLAAIEDSKNQYREIEADAACVLFSNFGMDEESLVFALGHGVDFAATVRALRSYNYTLPLSTIGDELRKQPVKHWALKEFGIKDRGPRDPAVALGTSIKEGLARYTLTKQLAIQSCVAQAAYDMGATAGRFEVDATDNKTIKDALAKDLLELGLGYAEVAPIIRNMVEAIRNV
jgi:hypothetical protein